MSTVCMVVKHFLGKKCRAARPQVQGWKCTSAGGGLALAGLCGISLLTLYVVGRHERPGVSRCAVPRPWRVGLTRGCPVRLRPAGFRVVYPPSSPNWTDREQAAERRSLDRRHEPPARAAVVRAEQVSAPGMCPAGLARRPACGRSAHIPVGTGPAVRRGWVWQRGWS